MTIAFTHPAPRFEAPPWARLTRVGPELWRVADGSRVVGHLRRVPSDRGSRYHAERFDAAARAFVTTGAFWTEREALDCLRYSR